MRDCRHEYLLEVQGGFYYCPNCPDEWTIQDLLRMDIENQARIKALEGVVELAEQHMFFFTKITMHRSESKKCKKKKCLVCAELELQDTATVINLMNAISKLEEV